MGGDVLRLPDDWVWDSWVADDGDCYHLFFLKAREVVGDHTLRHYRASVGHARSTDLVHWELLPDALGPRPGGWDDRSIWTGSVAQGDDGVWRMYYTALSHRGGDRPDQRIGLAESDDLLTWRRWGHEPLLEVDHRWYEYYDDDPSASDAWRDPQVFRDPGGDGWHMLLTARVLNAAPNDGGVLGHARSHDMRHWAVGPPLSRPAGFRHLEVPQVRVVDGRPLLMFSCLPGDQTEGRLRRTGRFSLWTVTGDSVVGLWDVSAALPFAAEPFLYAAPLVQLRDSTWVLLGFRNTEAQGRPALEITDPLPVRLHEGVLVRV